MTQRPWDRIPLDTRTVILNPIVACLAGGRNKSVAAKAYGELNTDMACSGLQIKTPFTVSTITALMGARCLLTQVSGWFGADFNVCFMCLLCLQVCDVEWDSLRDWVDKLGGFAVIKVPYSNAGQVCRASPGQDTASLATYGSLCNLVMLLYVSCCCSRVCTPSPVRRRWQLLRKRSEAASTSDLWCSP